MGPGFRLAPGATKHLVLEGIFVDDPRLVGPRLVAHHLAVDVPYGGASVLSLKGFTLTGERGIAADLPVPGGVAGGGGGL